MSPAAVPERPRRPEMASSTSLTMSRTLVAGVQAPRLALAPLAGGGLPVPCQYAAGMFRQGHADGGVLTLPNANSKIP